MAKADRPLRIVVAEPAGGGHHFSAYVRYAVRGMLGRGWTVGLLTTASALAHPAYAILADEFGFELECHEMPEIKNMGSRRFALAQRQLAYWGALRNGFQKFKHEQRMDCVLMTTMDGVDKAIALLGSPFGRTPLAGIMIGLNHHWASIGLRAPLPKDRINAWLFRRLLARRSVRAVMTIDPTFADASHGLPPAARSKLFTIPDPGEVELIPRAAAREQLGIDDKDFVILVYGEITLRKSIESLAGAWLELAPKLRQRVRLLFAGAWRDDVRKEMSAGRYEPLRSAGKLTAIDRYVDSATESAVFSAADAVWCAYAPSFMKPSAVLSQAASAGLPVIGSRGGLVGRIVQGGKWGLLIDPADMAACTAAITELVENHDLRRTLCNNSREFRLTCSAQAFGDAVCAAVQKATASVLKGT